MHKSTKVEQLPRKNVLCLPVAGFDHHKLRVKFDTEDDLAPNRLQFLLEQRLSGREVWLLGKHIHKSILSLSCIFIIIL